MKLNKVVAVKSVFDEDVIVSYVKKIAKEFYDKEVDVLIQKINEKDYRPKVFNNFIFGMLRDDEKTIVLNSDFYNKEIIYPNIWRVMIHEIVHLKIHGHSREFFDEFLRLMKETKVYENEFNKALSLIYKIDDTVFVDKAFLDYDDKKYFDRVGVRKWLRKWRGSK